MADQVDAARRVTRRAAAGEGDVEAIGKADPCGGALQLGEMAARRIGPAGAPGLGPERGHGQGWHDADRGRPSVDRGPGGVTAARAGRSDAVAPVARRHRVEGDPGDEGVCAQAQEQQLTLSQAAFPGGKRAQVEIGAIADDLTPPPQRADQDRLAQPGQAPELVGDGAQVGVERRRIAAVPAAIAGADPNLAVEGEIECVGGQDADQARGEQRRNCPALPPKTGPLRLPGPVGSSAPCRPCRASPGKHQLIARMAGQLCMRRASTAERGRIGKALSLGSLKEVAIGSNLNH